MRRGKAFAAVGAVGVVVVAFVAAWRSSPDADGPLGKSATVVDATICTPDTDGLDWWYSADSLRNQSTNVVTLDKIELVKPVNVELVEAFVYPIARTDSGDFLSLGASGDDLLPAGADEEPGTTSWAQRAQFRGATVTRGTDPGYVLHLRSRSTDTSGFESLSIRYQSDGDDYVLRTNVRAKVQRTPCF